MQYTYEKNQVLSINASIGGTILYYPFQAKKGFILLKSFLRVMGPANMTKL